jgi:enoyl-CoA hydratase
MDDVLRLETVGDVRVVVLNRPRARNALNGSLITALYAALTAADADDAVRAIVLTGADPAFCAGIDLKEAARDGEAYFRRFQDVDPISVVPRLATPVVGAVNGAAFTGGLEMALGCDFLLASERAVFADTHARVGVLPGGGLTARLPAQVGSGWARRLSMTSEVIDAATAQRIGLVTEVVAHDRLMPRALEIAAAVAEVPAETMQALKRMYVEAAQGVIGPALQAEQRIGARHAPDFSSLEQRRTAVMARNRAKL